MDFSRWFNEVRSASRDLGKHLLVNSLQVLTEGPCRAIFRANTQQFACKWVIQIWALVWELTFEGTRVLKRSGSCRLQGKTKMETMSLGKKRKRLVILLISQCVHGFIWGLP